MINVYKDKLLKGKKGKKFVLYQKGFVKGLCMAMLVTFLFYRDFVLSGVLSAIFAVCYMFYTEKEYEKKQKYEITLEFREGLHGISAALGAGYSMENAITEAKKDLELLYGTDSLLVCEFSQIERQLELNMSLENALDSFAKRWQAEDIVHFVKVFQTAKRTGGDLIAITRMAAERIGEKIEVKREIYTIIAGKKLEGSIMNVIPLGIIFYFWISSPDFLDCLYTGGGRILMTVLMLIYLVALYWSRKINDIQV